MRAVTYHGTGDFRVDTHPDPEIKDPKDAIIKVTSTAICGSDLHMFDGFIPAMEQGDIIGHEFMGEVVETGSEISSLKKGDRIVVPFTINCGHCHWCAQQLYSLCDETNPDGEKLRAMNGQQAAGLFGYSHLYGGWDGGQAEYVRVPWADATHLKVPDHLSDEQVLFLTDIFPTGYQAAVNAGVKARVDRRRLRCGSGRTCSPSSPPFFLGATRVFAIDDVAERLALAKEHGAEIIDISEAKAYDQLMEATERHVAGMRYRSRRSGSPRHGDRRYRLRPGEDGHVSRKRTGPHALREAIMCTQKGGDLSIPRGLCRDHRQISHRGCLR